MQRILRVLFVLLAVASIAGARAVVAQTLVPGGGPAKSDCYGEWLSAAANRGATGIDCQDGDPDNVPRCKAAPAMHCRPTARLRVSRSEPPPSRSRSPPPPQPCPGLTVRGRAGRRLRGWQLLRSLHGHRVRVDGQRAVRRREGWTQSALLLHRSAAPVLRHRQWQPDRARRQRHRSGAAIRRSDLSEGERAHARRYLLRPRFGLVARRCDRRPAGTRRHRPADGDGMGPVTA
jgi:hypothetical protein